MRQIMHLESDGKGGFIVHDTREGCLTWVIRIVVLAALIYAMDRGYIKPPKETKQNYEFVEASERTNITE